MRSSSTLALISRPGRFGDCDSVEIVLSPTVGGCDMIMWRGRYVGSLHYDGQLHYAQDLNGLVYCGLFTPALWWLLDQYVSHQLARVDRSYGGGSWNP